MIDRRKPVPRRQCPDRRKADRRQDPREPFEAPIRFLRSVNGGMEVLSGELMDVSASGIRILLDKALEQGERILVEVRLSSGECFNLSAQVVWVEHQPDRRCLVGCELQVDLTKRQFARLRALAAETSVA
ncbi:MAG: PilZ domain-containing protein [Planctomycetes bacterium]|nr:PilZ domain-containing protein [Planctomycetota bacterium]